MMTDIQELAQAVTQEEFVERGGFFCPYCQHDRPSYNGDYSWDEQSVWSKAKCDKCGRQWEEQHILVGYRDVE